MKFAMTDFALLGMAAIGVGLLAFFVVLRWKYITWTSRMFSSSKPDNVKVFAVVGSGGHTMELLRLMENLSPIYAPRIYIIAHSDHMSRAKVENFELHGKKDGKYAIIRTVRSREVGQGYISSIFSTLYAFLEAVPMVWRHQPDLVLCNGPGTCIPICGAAFLLRIFFLAKAKILYVESICRISTLSLSARILYAFADRVLVQWKSLHDAFPKADFIGRFNNWIMSHTKDILIEFARGPLDVNRALEFVLLPWTGGTSCFVGTTRSSFDSRNVLQLEYEAYEPMAFNVIKKICNQIRDKWVVGRICIFHRLGEVPVKDASIIIAVSAEHRKEALLAVDFAINQIKAIVPIWKKEVYDDMESVWKENPECPWKT